MGSLAEVASAEVRAEMARQRRTQAELADVLGRTSQTASRRLSGQGFALDELHIIAEWLGVPVVQFLGPVPA